MAGQARRGERRTGRSSRADSSWALTGAASAVASGSDIATSTTPLSPDPLDSTATELGLRTRATYRNLIMRGLGPDEAANLTAFLAGIAVGDTHWTLPEINQLLFLREMNRNGHFAEPTETPLP